MNGMRQKIQYSLALELVVQGETPVSSYQGAEPFVAKLAPESPALTEQLMEEVCDRGNLVRAWKRVRQNKGSPGVDGMTIDDTKDYLREHWPSIRSQLLKGTLDLEKFFDQVRFTRTFCVARRSTSRTRCGQLT